MLSKTWKMKWCLSFLQKTVSFFCQVSSFAWVEIGIRFYAGSIVFTLWPQLRRWFRDNFSIWAVLIFEYCFALSHFRLDNHQNGIYLQSSCERNNWIAFSIRKTMKRIWLFFFYVLQTTHTISSWCTGISWGIHWAQHKERDFVSSKDYVYRWPTLTYNQILEVKSEKNTFSSNWYARQDDAKLHLFPAMLRTCSNVKQHGEIKICIRMLAVGNYHILWLCIFFLTNT